MHVNIELDQGGPEHEEAAIYPVCANLFVLH